MYRWVPAMPIVLIASTVIVLVLCAFTHGPSPLLNWIPGLVYLTVVLLFLVPRHFALAKKMHALAAEKGLPVFTATTDRIRCDVDGNATDLRWASIHSLCVSPETIYIFVDRRCSWFVPRGTHDERLLGLARSANVRIRGLAEPR
jgi:hypothetical protein